MQSIKWPEYRDEKLKKLNNLAKQEKIKLVIINANNDKASKIYIKQKIKAAKIAGMEAEVVSFSNDTNETCLIKKIEEYNKDNSVNGIIVQLPLPEQFNTERIVNCVNPDKDVDGLTKVNQTKLINGENCFIPCTAKAVLEMLNILGVFLEGKKISIIGRTKLVGIPLYHLLLQKKALPTICHSETPIELRDNLLKNSDIIISAAGAKKPFISAAMVKDRSIIIDVSIRSYEDTNKFHGDVCYEDVVKKVSYVSPVPGGVGPMTVLSLMENTYEAYWIQKNKIFNKK